MKIHLLQINHLKSLESFRFAPHKDLNILTGPNNAGKSTPILALRMIQHLAGQAWPSSAETIDLVTDHKAGVTPLVSLQVEFAKEELEKLHRIFRGSDRLMTFEFAFPVVPKQSPVILDRLLVDPPLLVTNTGHVREVWSADKSRATTRQLTENGLDSWPFSSYLNIQTELAKPLHDSTRRISLDPLRLLLQEMFVYDPHRIVPQFVPVAGPNRLDGSVTHLARCIADKLGEQDERFRNYEALISELSPGLGKLITKRTQDGNQMFVGFRRANVDINIAEMGTGVQQLLALCYQLVFQEAQFIVLEEPEIHLHPAAQRALFRAIREAAKSCQILLVTHSPLFIDRTTQQSNWVVSLDDKHRTTIKQLDGSDSMRSVRDALGVTVGDSLFAGDVILVVEGATEQVLLPLLTRMARESGVPSVDFERVSVVNAGGFENVRSVLRIVKTFGVPTFVLVDGTRRAHQQGERWAQMGLIELDRMVFVEYGDGRECELEDVLPLEKYLTALGDHYRTAISPDDYVAAAKALAAERHGKMPKCPQVCGRILEGRGLIEPGDDYDKIEVAVATAGLLASTEIPTFYCELSTKIGLALGE